MLLVALGSDYNVFVAGRIWEEARWMRLREAIAVATPAAAKAVTVAGLALAASFALLAIVPLRSFREFAFVMAAGVLLDTFVVRSLLVPALTSLFGEAAGGRAAGCAACRSEDIVERVASRTGPARPTRRRRSRRERSPRSAIGSRRASASVLARPPSTAAARAARRRRGGAERFPVDEFLARARARGRRRAASHRRRWPSSRAAVLTTLEEAAPDDLAYVRAQLSSDYDPLFRRR